MVELDLQQELSGGRGTVEDHLREYLAAEILIPARLFAAMSHSLLSGGKRLRPLLLLWTHAAFARVAVGQESATAARVMRAACAMECLHTYSLIHDDLPAMDDDNLRRGLPTCHVAFDEATAILAGDALQALGFRWLAMAGGTRAAALVDVAAVAVGAGGMVGGQQLDLDSEGQEVTAQDVQAIHELKTGALLAACLVAGGLLAGQDETCLAQLHRAGKELGLAFQGADDLLDCRGAAAVLGKTPGKDAASEKATWIRVEGEGPARERMLDHGRTGLHILEEVLPAGIERDRILSLGHFMFAREA